MSDKIILEYGAKYDELDKAYASIEKDLKGIESASDKSMGELEKDSKKSAKAIGKNTKEIKSLSEQMRVLANNLPFASQIKQVNDFGRSVLNVGNSASKSAGMFKVLKVAIASTGIGALVVAIGGLIAYFKRTDEGGTRLAGIMSALGAVLDRVTGAFISIGEKVFNAFTSFENFKQGLKDLGNVIVENLVNRLKAPLLVLDALVMGFKEFKEKGIKGDFSPAIKLATDGLLQLVSGVTDATSKISKFGDEISKAAKEAFDWEERMDALNDKIRENSKTLSANEKEIARLIVASKNKQISDEESLRLLQEASRLEKENLAIVLENENTRLKLIQERNKREEESINQGRKLGEKRLSINDELAQEEVDIINRINQLQGESFRLQERINNSIDARKEEIFQNELKRIAQLEVSEENSLKERFLNQTINAEELEKELFDIKLRGLEAQKQALIEAGRETIEIEKAILDLRISNIAKSDKEKEKVTKDLFAEELNEKRRQFTEIETLIQQDFINGKINQTQYAKQQNDAKKEELQELRKLYERYGKDVSEIDKQINDEIIKNKLELKEKIKFITAQGIGIASELINGFAANNNERRNQEFEEERQKLSAETEFKKEELQKQLDNGIISQEQFNARKRALDNKQKQEEAKIKKEQFEANKRAALTEVAINTALAIVKTLATSGIPAGLALAAVAAAQGAAQAAVISSKPVPKFKDGVIDLKGKGTGTSDSNLALLSRGESVMTARETSEYKPLLKSIRDNTIDDFINKSYVLPALQSIQAKGNRERAQRQSQKEAKIDALLSRLDFDTSNLERVVRGNKNVGISNTRQLAKDIARETQINSSWYK